MNLLFAISSEVYRYQSYLSIDQARIIYRLFLLPLMREEGITPSASPFAERRRTPVVRLINYLPLRKGKEKKTIQKPGNRAKN